MALKIKERTLRAVIYLLQIILFFLCSAIAIAKDFDPKKIYTESSKAVVVIAAFEKGQQVMSKGTGSIISENGLVLTNAHVVINKKEDRPFSNLRVFLKPDKITGNLKQDTSRKYKAEIIQFSEELDLALLKIKSAPTKKMPPTLNFSDSDHVSIGDPVVAIGHPEQGGLWTLTTGTISSHRMDYGNITGKNVFQTEASLNRGNSGGPLIDGFGRIIGINSMISRRAEDGLAITGINFSIKSRVALKWLGSIGVHIKPKPQPIPPSLIVKKLTPSLAKKLPSPQASEAAIIPIPKVTEDKLKETNTPKIEKKNNIKSIHPKKTTPQTSKILTVLRPFKDKDLMRQVEDEMEDMINEMRGKENLTDFLN